MFCVFGEGAILVLSPDRIVPVETWHWFSVVLLNLVIFCVPPDQFFGILDSEHLGCCLR